MSKTVKLDEELKQRIQAIAQTQRRTAHWIMREAIEQYVDRAEKRASFLRDAQQSWEDYQRTGRHVTWEEMEAWLKTVGMDAQKEPPECHE